MATARRPARTCFVIAPFGKPGSRARKRADKVFGDIIAPAAKACGYKAVRADKLDEPGLITEQVATEIVRAPLVVADLTGRNPNVFYELALRHAVNKPVVQMIAKGGRIPFNVSNVRTVEFDLQNPDSVEKSKLEVIRQIRASETNWSGVRTPLERAIADALKANEQVRRFSGVTEMYDYVAGKLSESARTIDDITWGLRRVYASPEETGAYERYVRSMRSACERSDVAYREISTLSSREYFQRAVSLARADGYHLGWYDTTQCRLPLMSFMLIDDSEVVFAFYRFESTVGRTEIYASITARIIVELFRDYFETLWGESVKLKLGRDIDCATLKGIALGFRLNPKIALRDLCKRLS